MFNIFFGLFSKNKGIWLIFLALFFVLVIGSLGFSFKTQAQVGDPQPIYLWHLDKGVGLFTYDEISNTEMELQPNPWRPAAQWTFGKWGRGIKFPYSAVARASVDLFWGQEQTIEFWLRTDEHYVSEHKYIYSACDTQGVCEQPTIYAYWDENGNSGMGINAKINGQWQTPIGGLKTIDDGLWHYLAVTIDMPNDIWKVYVDADKVAEGEIPVDFPSQTSGFHLSDIVPEEYQYIGDFDELAITSRVLTAEEILTYYQTDQPHQPYQPPPAPITPEILHLWHLDENTGTKAVDEKNQTEMDLIGPVNWIIGKWGSALDFSNPPSYTFSDIPDISEKEFSIEFWLKTDKHYTNKHEWIFCAFDTGPECHQPVIGLYYDAEGKTNLYLNAYFTTDWVDGLSASKTLDDNQWHHIAATIDQNRYQWKLYVDGELLAENYLLVDFPSPTTALAFSYYVWDPAMTFTGQLDEIVIWKGALSPEQIRDYYQSNQPHELKPPTKTINVAVILAEPAGTPHNTEVKTYQPCKLLPEKQYAGFNKEYYQDLAYCVNDYYKENSYGTVQLNFEIFDNEGEWYRLDKGTNYYKDHLEELISSAETKVKENKGINLPDDKIVIVIYSDSTGPSLGFGQAKNGGVEAVIYENRLVGTWAHEIGHILGVKLTPEKMSVPDLYNSGLAKVECLPIIGCFEQTTEGHWDLMATGSRNGTPEGFNPSHTSSYTKEFLKWLNYGIHPKSEYHEYWINSLETSKFGDKIFRYNLSDDTDAQSPKYYILEARNRDPNLTKWDTSLPEDKSLVLYYVDKTTPPGTITILGYSDPTNNAVLNPSIHEVFRDLNNLVKFTAQSDKSEENKYQILAKIDKILIGDFPPSRFASAILLPGSTFRQKIPILGLTESDSNFSLKEPPVDSSFPKYSNYKEVPFISEFGGEELKFQTKIHNFIGQIFIKLGLTYQRPFVSIPLKFSTKISIFILLILFILTCVKIIQWKIQPIRKKLIKIIVKIILIIILFIIFCWIILILFYPQTRWFRHGPEVPGGWLEPTLEQAISPDLDLHLYCNDGKHIGMNYQTGEYENQIPGSLVSGDNQIAPEWIYVPAEMSANCRFVVSSYDNQKFLEENPEIAQQIEDKSDSYEIYARYIDPATDIYTSATLTESIQPGQLLEQPITGTTDIQVLPAQPFDTIAPTTSISLEGTLGQNNWYVSDMLVSLSAVDNENGTGVEKIEYSFDEENWITYTEPFLISQEGIHNLYYRSVDKAGNLEETKTKEIKIDKTPPEITITSPIETTYFNTQDPLSLIYIVNDNIDLQPTITAYYDSNLYTQSSIDLGQYLGETEHALKVIAFDEAGNTNEKSVIFKVIPESMKSFLTKKMTIFWGLDCPEIFEELEEIDDFEGFKKKYQILERNFSKKCSKKKDSFIIFGSLELPDEYQKTDLDKSAFLYLQIADKLGKDKVAFKELKNLWLYQEPWKWKKTDGSLGQGIDIKNMLIHWLSEKECKLKWQCQEKFKKNWFYIRGELSLEGIDVNTLPREATITLEIPVTPYEQAGSLAGKETIEFKKFKHTWFYHSPIKWKDWQDGWWKKRDGFDFK